MRHALVLRLSALGDVIHTLPAVEALRVAHPGVEISWVVEAPYRELVETVAGVRAIPVRMKTWGRSAIASRREIRDALRAMRGADASIDFQGLVKSAALGWLSGAALRFGFDSAAIREKPALLFTNRKAHVDTSKHVVEQNIELALWTAAAVNVGAPPARPGPSLDARDDKNHWEEFADGRGLEELAGAVVLLPGAGKPIKLWPLERFRTLAKQLGPQALAVWGPGERELAEGIGARMAPPTNLRELAWLLKNARLVVGADTGPLHLAAALGTPVVGLYGPTDPRRNGPWGQIANAVDHFRSTKLMESITVEEVVKTIEQVIAP